MVQSPSSAPVRRRNARGEGTRLAEEIVTGALAIIERTGSEEAITLRSVAREVGIAAPSIYAHFPDRDAVIWAVVVRVFEELRQEVAAASGAQDDPVAALIAGCQAYLDFGMQRPGRYRVLFARPFPEAPGWASAGAGDCAAAHLVPQVGAEAFALLVDGIADCVAAGRSQSTDPFTDATALWVALHGMVSLSSTMCGFPWPEPGQLVQRLVRSLGRIDAV